MKKSLLFVFMVLLLTSLTYSQTTNFYLGVNNPNITTSCGTCHSALVTSWEATGHAIAQDSVSSSHYGYSCLKCHNTGWNEAEANWGADEYVTQDTNASPDYVITDQTKWDLVKNVQCESCHGPVGNSDETVDMSHTSRFTDVSADNCGVCHEGSHHPYISEWTASGHASGAPVWLNRQFAGGSCMYCHFAQDFVAFLDDPSYNGATFVPEGGDDSHLVDITCVTCHDPHGNNNPGNLRTPVSSAQVICDVCHTVHTDVVNVDDTPHHTTSEALSGAANFGYQYPGQTYSNSPHTAVATDRCIDCHVYKTPWSPQAPAVTGHTFEPRVESCADAACHGQNYYTLVDTSDHSKRFDLYGAQAKTDSLMTVLGDKLGLATAADSTTDEFKQARYNLQAVEAEGSHGIHNTKLVQELLQDAIAGFTPTGIRQEEGLPTQYALEQNYPNPFNPSTSIKFAIPSSQDVQLIIFDALGKQVDVLVDKRMNAGNYTFDWNANQMSTGIYFYQLTTKDFVKVRKMILLK